MYCGNNANVNIPRGTRYSCFKKGIGVGLNLPLDPEAKEYKAFEPVKIYCGDKPDLPQEYKDFGTLSGCLRKGVGVGKKLKSNGQAIAPGANFGFTHGYRENRILVYVVLLIGLALFGFGIYALVKKKALVGWICIALSVLLLSFSIYNF